MCVPQKAAEAAQVEVVRCDVIYEAIAAVEKRLVAPGLFQVRAAGAADAEQAAARAIVKQIFPLSNVRKGGGRSFFSF